MVAGTEPGPLGKVRAKLLDFLEESKFYSPAAMLSRYNFSGNALLSSEIIFDRGRFTRRASYSII